MTAPNNNYVVGAQNLDNDNRFYQSADVGAFNVAGDFAAYVLFWFDGHAQSQELINAFSADIWGNRAGGGTGWSFDIAQGGAPLPGAAEDMVLTATVGDGVAPVSASYPLSLSTVAPGIMPSYIKRLILATLFYDATGQVVWLGVNGSLQPPSSALGAPYAPSPNPAFLGLSGLNDDGRGISIASAGFTPMGPLFAAATTAGPLAAENFVKSQEVLGGAYFSWPEGIDWVHRYEFSSAQTQGTVQRTPQGTIPTAFPALPASLPDVGGLGFGNAQIPVLNPSPVSLIRMDGAGLPQIAALMQVRNPAWYTGGAFQFLGELP